MSGSGYVAIRNVTRVIIVEGAAVISGGQCVSLVAM